MQVVPLSKIQSALPYRWTVQVQLNNGWSTSISSNSWEAVYEHAVHLEKSTNCDVRIVDNYK